MKKSLVVNRRAGSQYKIVDEVEAGIVLSGGEVKALKNGKGSLVDGFVRVRGGEAFLHNVSISRYKYDQDEDYEATRMRKLLLKKKEIVAMESKMNSKKLVAIPMEIYLKGKLIKVLVGLGRGLKQFEKREKIRRRDLEREARRDLKWRDRGSA